MAERSGSRRVGVSRMDAALDAVSQMGYPRELVKTKMIELLKVYGGTVGYPFIEADAYKVLIEAILEDEDSKPEKTSMKTPNAGGASKSMESTGSQTPNAGGPSKSMESTGSQTANAGGITKSMESTGSQTPNTAQTEGGDGNRWKDITLDKTFRNPEQGTDNSTDGYTPIFPAGGPPPSPSLIATAAPPPPPPPPPLSIPARTRKPCYGYIGGDDEEEEIEFVYLTPMLPGDGLLFEQGTESLSSGPVRRSNRRSRWDVRPGDV